MARPIVHDDVENCGLTYSELQELWLGPCNGSVFDSPEQLRDAWARGRDVAMRLWGSHGRRPQAWWCFDTELEYPGYDRERSFLYAAGALTVEERDGLEREWKAAFDAARGMGARERREHLVHNDVPNELIEKWTAARRRRPKAIGKEDDAAWIPQPGNRLE
jgi:hypothetical protein